MTGGRSRDLARGSEDGGDGHCMASTKTGSTTIWPMRSPRRGLPVADLAAMINAPIASDTIFPGTAEALLRSAAGPSPEITTKAAVRRTKTLQDLRRLIVDQRLETERGYRTGGDVTNEIARIARREDGRRKRRRHPLALLFMVPSRSARRKQGSRASSKLGAPKTKPVAVRPATRGDFSVLTVVGQPRRPA